MSTEQAARASMSQQIRQNPEFETGYRGKWHLQMQHWLEMKNGPLRPVFIDYLAEEASDGCLNEEPRREEAKLLKYNDI